VNLYRQTFAVSPALPGLAGVRTRAAAALAATVGEAARGALHGLTIATEAADLAPARAHALRIRGEADHVLILGVGGSSLGAQAIAQLKGFATPLQFLEGDGPRLHFLDNLDAPSFVGLLDALPLARTHTLIVSKSGGTAETLMQTLSLLDELERRGGGRAAPRFVVITGPPASPLRRLAQEHGFAILDHPTDIGGRFSVLSIVGMLPALIMGLEAERIRAGAARVWREASAAREDAPCSDGAAFAVAGAEAGKSISVLMPYSDRLERFALWYRQLWAESLGKEGKGTLPVRALGPVDQHSQLQLYLAGPSNALFTILTEAQERIGAKVPKPLATGDLSYLGGRTMGELVMAEARATYDTLLAKGRPSRLIAIDSLNEESLGALFMHFMLETVLCARMIGVNAFDQPAVEDGKILAKRYLGALPT
jgi:glucose-6-phosphate isomerase